MKTRMLLRRTGSQAPRTRCRAFVRPCLRRTLCCERLEHRLAPASFIAVGTDAGPTAEVRIFADPDLDDQHLFLADSIQPFASFTGGARVAFGDFDGDTNDELVVAAGPGGGPRVIIFDLHSDGTIGAAIDDFIAFGAFAGGVFVAAGDLDGDRRDELFVSPDYGGAPRVLVFSDTDGDLAVSDNLVDSFFAYSSTFFGGVRLAAGDVEINLDDELITAPGPGGGPHIKVFDDTDGDRQVSDNALADQFFAYGAGFTGGVYVAAGRVANAGTSGADVITAPGAGGGPHVKIFFDSDGDADVSDHPPFDQFFAYGMFTGGVRVAAGDADVDVSAEVITVPGPGGGPHVKVFDDSADTGVLLSDNAPGQQFFAFPAAITSGLFVAFGLVQRAEHSRLVDRSLNDGGPPLRSSIFVPKEVGLIRDLIVTLYITHGNNEDIDVTLTHVPSNTTLTLFTDVGHNDNGFYVILDDSAPTDIGSTIDDPFDRPVAGRFNPEGLASLSVFDGLDASGEWLLTVADDQVGSAGAVFSWSLVFAV